MHVKAWVRRYMIECQRVFENDGGAFNRSDGHLFVAVWLIGLCPRNGQNVTHGPARGHL